ncbi:MULTISPECIES: hypothetical protein [Acinetobacter]|nr:MULTISPECIES: hypothetical protein [Acinetobacter]
MGTLKLDIKIGDILQIGEAAVQLEKKSGQLARLSVEADPEVKIKLTRKSASDSEMENQAHGEHAL